MSDDLRSALEAAYDKAERNDAPAAPEEAGGSKANAEEPVRDTAPTERSEPEGERKEPSGEEKRAVKTESEVPVEEAKPDQPKPEIEAKADEPKPEPRSSTKAPISWKPGAKEHWGKLPPEVQQEVDRREREITQTLQHTAEQRKLADRFVEATRPFEAMIRAEGRDPVVAAQELFATAAFLRTGTPAQKAQLVANMVKNFGIPIDALDQALVGEEIPDEDSKIAQLLDQRLKPVMGFIDEVKGLRSQREQQTQQNALSEIQSFAQDPKNEFFDDVREDMADLMELASKRGSPLTLQEAYDRAIRSNDEIQLIIKRRKEAEIAKKEDAASSIPSKGAPRPAAASGGSSSLRADIEAAFATVANR